MFTPPPRGKGIPRTPVKTVGEQIAEQKKKEKFWKMEDELKALVHQRGAVKGKLTRVRSAIEHSAAKPNPNIENLHFLQIQMDIVKRSYEEYNDFQNSILALALSDKQRAEHQEKYVEFESLYTDTAVKLSTLIECVTKPVPAPAPPSVVAVRQAELPVQLNPPALQVPLPTFDGSYERWFSFKSMFTTIMNRYQHEEPALKLYHLRNCLVGPAAGIIDQDIVNNNDYDAAWLVLKQRFEDKRIIVDKHVDNLFNLPRIGQESAVNMRKMIDVCTKNVEALKHQDLPVDGLGEQMLVNLIAAKMDKKLRVAWETRQKKDVLSTYAGTMEFLQEQCRIYEKIDLKSITEISLLRLDED